MSVKRHLDLLNTKEITLHVCKRPYHTNKGILRKWEKLENLRKYALMSIPPCSYNEERSVPISEGH